jgi:hypothetical protein
MAMLAGCTAAAAGAVGPQIAQPVLRVPLEPMGFETLSQGYLISGSSMLTVHFVDEQHLLVTFGVRRLMKREPDALPDDDDRVVGAYLVELPTGKVLARTEWRLHDHGQYLWSIGHGRFVLRVRDNLTMVAPMALLSTDDPFRQMPFLHVERHLLAILVSSDDDLMTIESTKRGEENVGFGVDATEPDATRQDPAPVQINFYRLTSTGDGADALVVASAGAIRTRTAVDLPLTTSGFLDVLEGGRNRWLFNFNSHAGRVSGLSAFETSCFPHATFVGHGEFVAFGCRGSDGRQELGGFNLKGEEMWQTNFVDTQVDPSFSFAPAAGRFALGRLITADGTSSPAGFMAPSQVGAQEVRVFQSYDGQQLLRVECSPVERAGQNFAMSPDGMRVAVVRENAVRHAATKEYEAYVEVQTGVEVYALPPLSETDKASVKEDEALAPPDTGARIDQSLMRASAAGAGDGEESAAGAASGPAVEVPVQAALTTEAAGAVAQSGAGQGGAGGSGAVWGDPQPEPERKAPTLYGPDEGPGKAQ